MLIGVPKEIKESEKRVSITPYSVNQIVRAGHQVIVESGAGEGSFFADKQYRAAGAGIVKTADEAWNADMVVKVKEPMESEFKYFKKGKLLFTYLHLASSKKLAEALLSSGITAFAYETVVKDGKLPLLAPMSEIAGKIASLVGFFYLSEPFGGNGVLPSGVPGVLPAKVLVIGAGVVGQNAALVAKGVGADVTIADIDTDKLKTMEEFGLKTIYAHPLAVANAAKLSDLVVGAVLVPGGSAPKIITKEMIMDMKEGSVIVDVAIDQGGCTETSRPTTHLNPVFKTGGVTQYCVTNMPAAYAATATEALSNATYDYIIKIADGWKKSLQDDEGLMAGLNIHDGKITHSEVAKSLNLPYVYLYDII